MTSHSTEGSSPLDLSIVPAWTSAGDAITRTFDFPTYAEGLGFAVTVGTLADRMDHHPDLSIGYCRVTVRLSSHDVGGVSARDVALATQIDAVRPA